MDEPDYTGDVRAKMLREAEEARKRIAEYEKRQAAPVIKEPESPWSRIWPFGVKPVDQPHDEYQKEQDNYTAVAPNSVEDIEAMIPKKPGVVGKVVGASLEALRYFTSPLAAPSAFTIAPSAKYDWGKVTESTTKALEKFQGKDLMDLKTALSFEAELGKSLFAGMGTLSTYENILASQWENFKISGEAAFKKLFPIWGEKPDDYGQQIAKRMLPNAPNWVLANTGMALEVLSDPTVWYGAFFFKTVQQGTQITRAQIRAGMLPAEGIVSSGIKQMFLMGQIDDPVMKTGIYSLAKKVDEGDLKAAQELSETLSGEMYEKMAVELEIKAHRQLADKLKDAFGVTERPNYADEMNRLVKTELDDRVAAATDSFIKGLKEKGFKPQEVARELAANKDTIEQGIWEAGLTSEELALMKNKAQVRVQNAAMPQFIEVGVRDAKELADLIETGQLHKAIKLNKYMVTPNNVTQLADELVMTFTDMWKQASRGRQPWSKSMALAQKIHLEELTGRKIGDVWNAEYVFAALQTRLVLAEEMSRLAIAVKKTGDPVYQVAYAQATQLFKSIATNLRASGAETGKALNVYKAAKKDYLTLSVRAADEAMDMVGRITDEGLDIVANRHAEMILKAKQIGVMHRFLERAPAVVRKVEDAVYESYLNGLLSAITTSVKNVVSNTVMTALVPLETGASIFFGAGYDNSVRTAFRMAYGIGQGALDAVAFYTDTLAQSKFSGMVRSEWAKEAAAVRMLRAEKIYPARYLDPEGLAKGLTLYNHEYDQMVRGKNISSTNFGLNPDKFWGWGLDKVGSFIRIPGAALRFQDIGFKFMGYRMGLHQNAFQKASRHFKYGTESFNKIYHSVLTNPSEEVIAAGEKMADYVTFQSALGETAARGQAFANTRMLRWFFPFIKTRINLFKRGVERTPLGYVPAIMKWAKGNPREAQIAATRATIGSSIIAGVALKIDTDHLVGHYDLRSPYGRKMHAMGIPPYSLKVNNKWVTFEGLDYLKTTIGMVANYKAVASALDLQDPEDVSTLDKISLAAMSAFSIFALDPGWTSEMGHLLYFYDAIAGGGLNVGEAALATAGKKLSMAIPLSRFFNAVNKNFVDEEFRMANDLITSVMAELPYLSQKLHPYRDMWGDPMTGGEAVGPDLFHKIYRFVSPFQVRTEHTDLVRREILTHPVSFPPMIREIMGVKLTKREKSELQRLTGKGIPGGNDLYTQMEIMMNTDIYYHATSQMKALMIENLYKGFREQAKMALLDDSRRNDTSPKSLFNEVMRKQEWQTQQLVPSQ